eukprot:CAMPEP_0174701764 /NCGR_PEP_ID=MMETSP1094-20130205/6298_1 /TAXON_ID=156173 /ORGANISM="Chrysochromulina brevifilum, Strain UTEX LB 985" /LENGTH=120 /DNA_ID=CAMNT_0015899457 /DNA_START=98 /DNA_END=457 /DNA_ORIENTATION=+
MAQGVHARVSVVQRGAALSEARAPTDALPGEGGPPPCASAVAPAPWPVPPWPMAPWPVPLSPRGKPPLGFPSESEPPMPTPLFSSLTTVIGSGAENGSLGGVVTAVGGEEGLGIGVVGIG